MQKALAFPLLVSSLLAFAANPAAANSTTVSSSSSSAVTASGSTATVTVTATGNLTVGGSTAAITLNGSNPSVVSVTNSGTIDQNGSAQAIVDAGGHMTITVNNGSTTNSSALIESSNDDTFHLDHATNNVILNNYGTITSLNTSAGSNQAINWNGLTDGGVGGQGSNTLNNFYSGVIQVSNADAVRPGVNGTINNSGTIKSTTNNDSSSDGIDAQSNTGITINNAASSTSGTGATNLIEGGRHGITGGDTGTLNGTTQTGTQPGGYTGLGTYAMTITNGVGGTIQGDDGSGINVDGFGIQGTQIAGTGNFRMITNEQVSVTNYGTITGNGLSRDGDGIDVDGDVTIDNFGTILSKNAVPEAGESGPEFSEGVTVGGGSITNETGATIRGSVASGNTQAVGRGITLAGIDHDVNDNAFAIQSIYENSSITNSGLIKGDSESGITVLGTTGGGYTVTITNNAGGTIEGNNTGVSEDTVISSGPNAGQLSGQSLNQGAIELDDTGNTYVINNSGTIQQDGASGKAVAMHGVSNTLNVTGGSAQIAGDIDGGTGSSTVNISPGSGKTFAYAGTVSGNTTVNVTAGGTFAIGGPQSGATASGTLTLNTSEFTAGTGTNTQANMNVANSTLSFALGAADSNTQIDLTGGVNTTLTFSSAGVAIQNLDGTGLDVGHEYVLIAGDGVNTNYSGLDYGATNSYGTLITGGLSLQDGNEFADDYSNSQLYLNGDNIDLVVATPEPSAWALGLLCCGAMVVLCRRQGRKA